MREKDSWVNKGTSFEPHYAYQPPKSWSLERIEADLKKIVKCIGDLDSDEIVGHGWLELIWKLPVPLRLTLLHELKLGNRIISVASGNWPSRGSVVVTVRERFHHDKEFPSSVSWRKLDDPHYCNEEVSQSYNEVEYLIIA